MEDKGPLHYHSDGQIALGIEALSQRARLSRAFVRLCIQTGCPTVDGRLSEAALINWLTSNYAKVRAAAGLRRLASVEGVRAQARRDLKLANTMITLLEFGESRSSSLAEKAQIRRVLNMVERSV